MTSTSNEIACSPERDEARVWRERRLGARAASFPQQFEPVGAPRKRLY